MRTLVCALLIFAASFGIGKWVEKIKTTSCAFEPTLYPIKDHPFVVIVIGRNNGAYVEKVLSSVFAQRYPNYRVIYVDNASDDGSFELAKDLIGNRGGIVKNESPLGKEASILKVKELCKEDEILVVLEQEEWLAHEWVLARLNQYYAHPDLKIAAGAFRLYPNFGASFEKGLVSCYASMLNQANFEELFEKYDSKYTASIPETFVIRRSDSK